jgi:hypothetical protein
MAIYDWATLRARLTEKVEHKAFWDVTEARDAFNEAMLTWNLLTGTWKRRLTIPTIANQYEYAISALMLYRMRITYNTQPLSSSSRQEFDNGRFRWRSETTASGGDVPTRPTLWAPISLQLFYLWPADAVGGGTLTLDGVSATPVVTHDSDLVDVEEPHLAVFLGYALHVLTFKKGGPAFGATKPLLQKFLEEAADENDLIKTSQVYRRWMGLDRRDLKPTRGTGTLLDALIHQPITAKQPGQSG